jgi:hypothetical protein
MFLPLDKYKNKLEFTIDTQCSLSDFFRIIFGNNRVKVESKRLILYII